MQSEFTIYLLTGTPPQGGTAWYVGQTKRTLLARFRHHCHTRKDFIPSGIAMLEICNDADSLDTAERKWIGLFRMFMQDSLWNRTNGGNGHWAPVMRDEIIAKLKNSMKEVYQRPGVLEAMSARMKILSNAPEVKASFIAAVNTPLAIAKRISGIRASHSRPEWRAANSMRQSEYMNRPHEKIKSARRLVKRRQIPEFEVKRIAKLKEAMNKPEVRAATSARMKTYWAQKAIQ